MTTYGERFREALKTAKDPWDARESATVQSDSERDPKYSPLPKLPEARETTRAETEKPI